MKLNQHLLLATGALLLAACQSGAVSNQTGTSKSFQLDADSKNITNAIFSERSSDCANYAGSYHADVTDIKRAKGFTGEVLVLAEDGACRIRSNDIPNHDFNDGSAKFATNVSEQDLNLTFRRMPTMASRTTPVSLGTSEAVFLNGVVVDLMAAACYGEGQEPLGREKIGCDKINHPWRYDPMSPLNNFGTDSHNAHVQPNGKYHYHGNPMAMFVTSCDDAESASPVIGFAADGFPVFGSCIRDDAGMVREALSSYRLKNNGGKRQSVAGYRTPERGKGTINSDNYDGQFRSDYEYIAGLGDLDECNGMTVDGQYGYYVTNEYPWVINCFKGQVDSSFTGRGDIRMHGHPPGLPPRRR